MNFTIENIDELNALLKVKVETTDYLPKVEATLNNYKKKAAIPGFRPGKAPSGVIKKMYGKAVLIEEVDRLLSDNIYKYLNENKLDILGHPMPNKNVNVDWDNQQEFEFIYDLGLSPKFEVNLSKSDTFDYHTIKIDETLVERTMLETAKRYGKVEEVESVSSEDYLTCDIVEVDANSEIIAGGFFKSATVFLPRLAEAAKPLFIGKIKGDKVIANAQDLAIDAHSLAQILKEDVKFAESFNAILQFTIKDIRTITAAEYNQELFDKVYGFGNVNSIEEFKQKIKEELANSYTNASDRRLYNTIVETLLTKINFDLPVEFLKRWIMSVNEKEISYEQVSAEFENYSKGLKWQLIENKIMQNHNLKVTAEELIAETKDLIKAQFGGVQALPMRDEELDKTAASILEKEEQRKEIFEKLMGHKMMDLFKNTFTLNTKELASEEFMKLNN
jgi:trigger factor